MTGSSTSLSNYHLVATPKSVTLANGSLSKAVGSGTTHLSPDIELSSVLHVPGFPFNLLSISKITKALNCSVSFYPSLCIFQDLKTRRMIGMGHEVDGLYYLDLAPPSRALQSSTSALQWHCRLGHPSLSTLKHQVPSLRHQLVVSCEACQLSKHHRASFPSRVVPRVSSPFELVHSDVWGPITTVSNKFHYFVTFVDDFSRMTWLFLMKNRSELFAIFQIFRNMIKTQFAQKIRILRSDNAKEYMSHSFASYLSNKGIIHQTSCAHTPQQNGVAERKNRHLLDVTRCLLSQMHVPKQFWTEAVLTACYLINRMPSSVLEGASPHSLLYPSSSPFSLPLKVFGCVCYVHNLGPGFDKLDPHATKCVFLGYSTTQKGYRCYSPVLRRYFTCADVTFDESLPYFRATTSLSDSSLASDVASPPLPVPLPLPPYLHAPLQVYQCWPRPSAPAPAPPLSSLSSTDPVLPPPSTDLPIAKRKGTRSCTTKHPISQFVSTSSLSTSLSCFVSHLSSISIPKTVQVALSDSGWRQAMELEMKALHHNGTWELVPLPPDKKTVGCKWVYTVKFHPDGLVERLKARLVAKGYTQTYGIDYDDTFSPVAKISSVRVLISLATNLDWPLFQLDVKNAFLHGDLCEEVYMEQPPGFVAQGESQGYVCKLRKALYGLKQSPRAWFGKFFETVLKFGLQRCQTDHSVFHLHTSAGYILLVVYVDDIVITGDDSGGIARLKQFLQEQFHTKDLGKLRYFLGIEVARSRTGINLSQRKYALDLLEETGLLGSRPVDIPMDPNKKLLKDEGELFEDPGRYRRLVGKLNYLTITRPDISYAVSVVSQFLEAPRVSHWEAITRIIRYLKRQPGLGILYRPNGHLRVEGFTSADWAGSPSDRRPTTGYCTFFGGNLVTWKSKKQTVVARSSAEAEYRAMAYTATELTWLQHFLQEIGFSAPTPIPLSCDNQAAIHIASNPVFHKRTKHIEVDCHYVRDKILNGDISTTFVKSGDQLADMFTKSLCRNRLEFICSKLGLYDIYAPA
jgi:transposase InsO family protein